MEIKQSPDANCAQNHFLNISKKLTGLTEASPFPLSVRCRLLHPPAAF